MGRRDENLARFVRDSVKALRRANLLASQASEKWNLRNEEFKSWCKAEGIKDINEIAKIKEKNLTLKAAMDTWSFWEREAKRIASYIEAEFTLRKLSAIANGTDPESNLSLLRDFAAGRPVDGL